MRYLILKLLLLIALLQGCTTTIPRDLSAISWDRLKIDSPSAIAASAAIIYIEVSHERAKKKAGVN